MERLRNAQDEGVFPLEVVVVFPLSTMKSTHFPLTSGIHFPSNPSKVLSSYQCFVPLISKEVGTKQQKASTSCSCHWGDGAPPVGCGLAQLTDTTKHRGSGSPPRGVAASRDPDRNQGQEVGSRHPTPPGSIGSVLRDLWVPKRSQNRTCSRW